MWTLAEGPPYNEFSNTSMEVAMSAISAAKVLDIQRTKPSKLTVVRWPSFMRVGSCERVSSVSEGYRTKMMKPGFLYIARCYRCVKQSTDSLRFWWKNHLPYILLGSSHIHQYLSPIQILRRFRVVEISHQRSQNTKKWARIALESFKRVTGAKRKSVG